MPITRRPVLFIVARWATLTVGVGLTTYSLVRLVEVHDQIGRAAPWWWIGLIGVAATLLGLGPPRSARRGRDVGP